MSYEMIWTKRVIISIDLNLNQVCLQFIFLLYNKYLRRLKQLPLLRIRCLICLYNHI